jgi:predicted HAD superfamily hydrolase
MEAGGPVEPGGGMEIPEEPRKIGDIIYKNGKSYKIIGFTPEGKTEVEEVKTSTNTQEEVTFYSSAEEARKAELERLKREGVI